MSSTPLVELLDLAQLDDRTWQGPAGGLNLPHVFGGQLIAQSLVAGGLAHPADMTVHSIHTTFLRSGDPHLPVELHVRPLRSGRSISTVDVEASHGSRVLCHSVVSCTRVSGGISHARPAPRQAGPHESVDLHDAAADEGGLGQLWEEFSALEIRLAPLGAAVDAPHSASPARGVWMRSVDALPGDPLVHQGAIAYASDLMLMSTALTPHGHRTGSERQLAASWDAVSLDHAMWFRRPVRADDWLLFEHTTPMAHDSRALIESAVFDADLDPVAHVAQEALIRSRV